MCFDNGKWAAVFSCLQVIKSHNMKKANEAITAVAVVNGQQIVVIENGEKRVAVKPICDALGIDFSSQLQRLKRDEILSSTMVIITTVGGDDKNREMVTIPFKYVFGWLFTIDHAKVRPEVKDAVIRYKLECYDALYSHFVELDDYMKVRAKIVDQKIDVLEEAREVFRNAQKKIEQAKIELEQARSMTINDYRQMKAQMVLQFPEE